MTKTPKEQLSGLIKRRKLVKKRISDAAKGLKRGGSLKDEKWYEHAQKRFAISPLIKPLNNTLLENGEG
jgi:hypothetical protein